MMRSMKRRTVLFGVGGLAAMLSAGWFAWRESSRKAPMANRTAALGTAPSRATPSASVLLQATLPDLEGKDVAFSHFSGQPVVVNFWATWCAPCVEEMPELNLMAKDFPNVHFVGIGVDTVDNIRQFVDKVRVSYTLLTVGNAGVAMMRALGNPTGGLPFTVMLDAEGNMIDTILGQVKSADLRARITSIVTKSKT